VTDPTSSEPLLAALHARAPGAAEELVRTYRPVVREALCRFLAQRCRGRTDLADDLTHDVFVALFRDDNAKLRQFQGRNGCSLAGWLRVVAVRLAIDTLRRERRVVSMDDDSQRMHDLRRALASTSPGPEQMVAGGELGERLRLAVEALPPKDRMLVELHVLRGAPIEDVATALGASMNAVYVRKSRILDRLRRALGETA
jgi:RNA polymerase sigma-70 factor (ECF subfamily)